MRTRSLCPFNGRPIVREGCADYQERSFDLIAAVEPELVVISNRAAVYLLAEPDARRFAVVDDDGRSASTPEDAQMAWRAGLDELVERIGENVGRIVIVDAVPEFPKPTGSDTISLVRPDGNPQTISLDAVERRRGRAVEAHVSAAAAHEQVTRFDPVPVLCRDECSQVLDDRWVYYDDDHVSVIGAELVVSGFEYVWQGLPVD